jgi:hypothetical protein
MLSTPSYLMVKNEQEFGFVLDAIEMLTKKRKHQRWVKVVDWWLALFIFLGWATLLVFLIVTLIGTFHG